MHCPCSPGGNLEVPGGGGEEADDGHVPDGDGVRDAWGILHPLPEGVGIVPGQQADVEGAGDVRRGEDLVHCDVDPAYWGPPLPLLWRLR